MKRLASYVTGKWVEGDGSQRPLHNPTTEQAIAETSTSGIDFAAALSYARDRGGPALREMTFARRGELLRNLAKLIHSKRNELIELAIDNGGNTRSDAKFDIDGASATLAAHADLAEQLGDRKLLIDGDVIQVGRTARLAGQHIIAPRTGVAVHINAFNFPAWGLAEKAATALLAGMPVVSKPATATALVTHELVRAIVAENILPDGALSLVCGGAGDMLDHLGGQDVLAFTGSSITAATLRATAGVVSRSVHINVEADSLNAAVLAPDVSLTSETGQLFLRDVVRDMTQKAGQKCTAIRRVFVPESVAGEVAEALAEELATIGVGDPRADGVRVGPVATADQLRDVRAGIERLVGATEPVYGGDGGDVELIGVDGKGYFVGPVLRKTTAPRDAAAVHEHEVFGPVATLCVYSGDAGEAAELVQLGGGGLVASVYSDEREFYADIIPPLASYHGRIYMGSEKVAAQSPGPGTVLATLTHGGPGRAGGGEELGGTRGMAFYQQRTALQGDKGIIKRLFD